MDKSNVIKLDNIYNYNIRKALTHWKDFIYRKKLQVQNNNCVDVFLCVNYQNRKNYYYNLLIAYFKFWILLFNHHKHKKQLKNLKIKIYLFIDRLYKIWCNFMLYKLFYNWKRRFKWPKGFYLFLLYILFIYLKIIVFIINI